MCVLCGDVKCKMCYHAIAGADCQTVLMGEKSKGLVSGVMMHLELWRSGKFDKTVHIVMSADELHSFGEALITMADSLLATERN